MGVQFQVIGGAVVLVVLRYPPGPAQANQKAGAKASDFIPPN
jgi:hypothetical protein